MLYKKRFSCKSGRWRNKYRRVMPAVHFPTYNNQQGFQISEDYWSSFSKLTNSLTKRRRILPDNLTIPQSVKNSLYFMYPESSLPNLQQPTTRPYLEPDQIQSIPPQSMFWRSILILFSHRCLGLPSGLFPSDSPTKSSMHFFCLQYVPHSPPISFFLISSLEFYLVREQIIRHKTHR